MVGRYLTPRAHVRSVIAFSLPIMGTALNHLFLGVYYELKSSVERTVVWLVYKLLVTGMLYLWSKIAVYGAKDDCQALLIVFAMVATFHNYIIHIYIPAYILGRGRCNM